MDHGGEATDEGQERMVRVSKPPIPAFLLSCFESRLMVL